MYPQIDAIKACRWGRLKYRRKATVVQHWTLLKASSFTLLLLLNAYTLALAYISTHLCSSTWQCQLQAPVSLSLLRGGEWHNLMERLTLSRMEHSKIVFLSIEAESRRWVHYQNACTSCFLGCEEGDQLPHGRGVYEAYSKGSMQPWLSS